MRSIFLSIATAFAILMCTGVLLAKSYWGGKTMNIEQVKKKWGDKISDLKEFKSGTYEQKAAMAYSILTNKELVGKSYDEIKDLFGPSEGYYFSDSIPTYIVQRGKDRSEETWQLVFLMDGKDRVQSIIMHKNCCDHK